ncbi:MAG: FtsX-like permease family protein [Bacteroidetes bacterium]|jgi:ABC-type lipoprotein release transport system permease subunit|nr:FtsX-like permease family protein [Bacteroidota bacterium]
MILRLAWRNIWRNRRRTFITAASILFAVLFASFMESLQRGAWDNMISNVVNYYFGYVQVHESGYWEEQSIDKAFPLVDSLDSIGEIEEVQAVIPRIESFALASAKDNTAGVLVAGIKPEVEDRMTNLSTRIVEGAYLETGDEAALMASGVADRLSLGVGDTLVLISQGFRGVNAAGKYPIKGIAKFGSPDLNKQMVYLPLPVAQYFYGADGRVTSLALKLESQDDIQPVLKSLYQELDTSAYEVMDWKEMLPDLVEARQLDTAGNVIVYIILYLIIAFGIFGTILMMTKEREYEFGVLVSIGLQRWQLALSVWIEVVMLGVLGALSGILVSIPVVLYFKWNPIRFSGDMASSLEKFGFEPIFPATFEPQIFLTQALYVFLVTAVLAIYPIVKIRSLQPVEAMRA